MKIKRDGTLRMVGQQNGQSVELHCFAGRWFLVLDGVTIAENIKTVLQAHRALQLKGNGR